MKIAKIDDYKFIALGSYANQTWYYLQDELPDFNLVAEKIMLASANAGNSPHLCNILQLKNNKKILVVTEKILLELYEEQVELSGDGFSTDANLWTQILIQIKEEEKKFSSKELSANNETDSEGEETDREDESEPDLLIPKEVGDEDFLNRLPQPNKKRKRGIADEDYIPTSPQISEDEPENISKKLSTKEISPQKISMHQSPFTTKSNITREPHQDTIVSIMFMPLSEHNAASHLIIQFDKKHSAETSADWLNNLSTEPFLLVVSENLIIYEEAYQKIVKEKNISASLLSHISAIFNKKFQTKGEINISSPEPELLPLDEKREEKFQACAADFCLQPNKQIADKPENNILLWVFNNFKTTYENYPFRKGTLARFKTFLSGCQWYTGFDNKNDHIIAEIPHTTTPSEKKLELNFIFYHRKLTDKIITLKSAEDTQTGGFIVFYDVKNLHYYLEPIKNLLQKLQTNELPTIRTRAEIFLNCFNKGRPYLNNTKSKIDKEVVKKFIELYRRMESNFLTDPTNPEKAALLSPPPMILPFKQSLLPSTILAASTQTKPLPSFWNKFPNSENPKKERPSIKKNSIQRLKKVIAASNLYHGIEYVSNKKTIKHLIAIPNASNNVEQLNSLNAIICKNYLNKNFISINGGKFIAIYYYEQLPSDLLEIQSDIKQRVKTSCSIKDAGKDFADFIEALSSYLPRAKPKEEIARNFIATYQRHKFTPLFGFQIPADNNDMEVAETFGPGL